MARPVKIGLDYFPLDVTIDDDIELLEAECGLIGFAILTKLWQKIYSNGYFIEWNDDNVMLFARKINSELTIVNDVVNVCLRRGIFSKKHFNDYKVLTSKGIQKRYFKICSDAKRKGVVLDERYQLINTELIGVNTELIPIKMELSTQRKEKKKKVDNIKEKDKKPTQKQVFSDMIFEYTNTPSLIDAIESFVEMRKSIKAKLTENALKLMLSKLNKMATNDHDKIEILNQSIMNSYKGIFPLKNNTITTDVNTKMDNIKENIQSGFLSKYMDEED